MRSLGSLVHEMRLAAGLSQRALAQIVGTSQPAVVRYERGTMTPSWDTLQRFAAACGWQVRLQAEVTPDPHDVELAERLLEQAPVERLRALGRFAGLRESALEQG
jgi:transcriptional regulator with XRE-family HTH domain